MDGKLKKIENQYVLSLDNIIYKNDKLSIKNCEAVVNGYDLDELAEELTGQYATLNPKSFKRGVLYGFQKAVEIHSDKKFSPKDMIEFAKWTLLEVGSNTGKDRTNEQLLLEWKLTQKTEWDVEVEMIGPLVYTDDLPEDGEERPVYRPKVDKYGKIILKRK